MQQSKPVGAPTSANQPWVDSDDAPELTKEFFQQADIYEGSTLIRRGRPPTGNAKQLVTLRIDPDVLEALRATGPGWQSRVNEMLRGAVDMPATPTKP